MQKISRKRVLKKNKIRESRFRNILILGFLLFVLFFVVNLLTGTVPFSLYSYAQNTLTEEGVVNYDIAGPVDLSNYIAKKDENLVYCTAGTENLNMDIYYPKTPKASPNAVVVYVHGGGWHKGDKLAFANQEDWQKLLSKGFLFVSVNYRLAPENKFSTFVQDVKCAVRHLRANATVYGLDPNRIGIWGGSAGAHIASMVAFTSPSSFAGENPQYSNMSSAVQALVSYSGFYNLQDSIYNSHMVDVINGAFGAAPGSGLAVLTRASPIKHVTSEDPPTLIVHADGDKLAPLTQAKQMRAELKAKNVVNQFLLIQNSAHTFKPADKSKPMTPSRDEIGNRMVEFFENNL